MDVAVSQLFPLVEQFLRVNKLKKTHQAFITETNTESKKETKEENDLMKVYAFYLQHNKQKGEPKSAMNGDLKKKKQNEKEESSEDESSEEESSEEKPKTKAAPKASVNKPSAPKSKKAKDEEESDESDESDEEEVTKKGGKAKPAAPKNKPEQKKRKQEEESSEEESEDEESEGESKSQKKKKLNTGTAAPTKKAAKPKASVKKASSSEEEEEDEDEDEKEDEKEKKSQKSLKETKIPGTPQPEPKYEAPKGSKTPDVFRRFQRVDPEKVVIKDSRLKDNSFEAKALGGGDTWGAKANADLSVVKGKGFRHEKTKKKVRNLSLQ
eukprot:TRINITY_DN1571_c0_g1_i1.p1 TRINITY_DN1571_c0_g1~~TRINITY_DN1571_c0_g1_i1.p1  ORF type:complete len:338 (-),score=138.35 TRINITY_DN1571_c0_g1_i1:877-1851(-)